MAKKSKSPEKYILPSENIELETFIKKFKVEMMEHVIESIELAVKNRLPLVEIFQFKNSDFVITLSDNDYLTNLDHIFEYLMQNEVYEYCGKIAKLQKALTKIHDEKEKR